MLEQWMAGVLDFNGSVGMRLGSRQMQPYIAIYSKDREKLEQLREICPDFSVPRFVSRNLFISQIVSIRGTLNLLEKTFPYLNCLHEVAKLTIDFCKSRLGHINESYSMHELQLAEDIVRATSRPASLAQRLEVLEKWV